MVTDALKRSRGLLSYGLLAVAALYLVSGLSLMFKSKDAVGLDFAGKSAAFGYLFGSPVLIVCLVAAVALVSGLGEPASNARAVVLAALVIAGLAFVLAVITFFASLGAGESGYGPGIFGGVLGAGKIVGVLLGVARLLLLGLAAWFTYSVLRASPKTVPQSASGQHSAQGYDGSAGPGQTGWSQPEGGELHRGWDRPPGAGDASPPGATAASWADPYQGQPEQQGLPASQWLQPEASYLPAPGAQPGTPAPADPGQEAPVEGEQPPQRQSWWQGPTT